MTLNLYTYVENNPLIYWDPSGNKLVKDTNQIAYLNDLVSQGGGNAIWAQQQLDSRMYYYDDQGDRSMMIAAHDSLSDMSNSEIMTVMMDPNSDADALTREQAFIALGKRAIGFVASGAKATWDWLTGANETAAVETETQTVANNANVVSLQEVKSPNPVRAQNVASSWDNFLGGGETTNINPRTGQVDPNRIFSADGTRSIRYGDHEMNSSPTKHHYHEETWTYDGATNTWYVTNTLVRIQK